jgi:EmrB/QacA subfamily drug resistance transporter
MSMTRGAPPPAPSALGGRLAPWRRVGVPRADADPAAGGGRSSVPRHGAAALALILTVAFMVVLDFSIVNVALASIERELHAGTAAVQWVITAYAITFGGLLVLGGRIGDLFGRRRTFVLGLVLFSLASLSGGLATSIGVLIAARAVQGIGAALVAPAALSLITTSTPEGLARNRALGYYGATASIGFVAGLVFGGVLVQYFDWRAVLWVNVPIGLIAAALAPVLIADASRGVRTRLDFGGALLVTGAIAALVYGVSEGPELGWASATTLGALALAITLGVGFVHVEQRHPAPLVRLGMLRRRRLRSANVAMILLGAWSAGELLTVPLFFQLVLHYSALTTGLAMAPQGIIGFLGASRGASIVRRVGVRSLMIASTGAAAAGLFLLGVSFASHEYALYLPGFMLAGFGTAVSAFGATVAATHGVEDREQGLAGGLINMSRQVGAAVGVALTAAIIGTGAGSGGSVGPDRASLFVIASFGVLAAVIAARGIGARVAPAALAAAELHESGQNGSRAAVMHAAAAKPSPAAGDVDATGWGDRRPAGGCSPSPARGGAAARCAPTC